MGGERDPGLDFTGRRPGHCLQHRNQGERLRTQTVRLGLRRWALVGAAVIVSADGRARGQGRAAVQGAGCRGGCGRPGENLGCPRPPQMNPAWEGPGSRELDSCDPTVCSPVCPASRGLHLTLFAWFPDLPGKGGGREAVGWAGSCLF